MPATRTSPRPGGFWLPLAGAVLLAVGYLLGLSSGSASQPLVVWGAPRDSLAGLGGTEGALAEVARFVAARYVDDFPPEQIEAAAIDGLVEQLDPYSAFVPRDALVGHRDRLSGYASDFGFELRRLRDTLAVASVAAGSAAASGGLEPYDRVLAIEGVELLGPRARAAVADSLLAGLGGSPARLTVLPRGKRATRTLRVLPTSGEQASVEPGRRIGERLGYVAVTRFTDQTYEQFMAELEALSLAGVRDLVLDLRGNAGGYLQEAVDLLSQLFPDRGRLLVYTEGAHSPRKEYTTTGRVFFPVDRVAVLVDGGSASASEVIAAAVQDWDRGLVVGRPTFGKGYVQELFELRTGGALHLSVSRYYAPSGRSIERADRLEDGDDADGGVAYATAGGRTVYAGQGVVPDVLVTSETAPSPGRDRLAEVRARTQDLAFALGEDATLSEEALLRALRARLAEDGYPLEDDEWSVLSRQVAPAASDVDSTTLQHDADWWRGDDVLAAAVEAIRAGGLDGLR